MIEEGRSKKGNVNNSAKSGVIIATLFQNYFYPVFLNPLTYFPLNKNNCLLNDPKQASISKILQSLRQSGQKVLF